MSHIVHTKQLFLSLMSTINYLANYLKIICQDKNEFGVLPYLYQRDMFNEDFWVMYIGHGAYLLERGDVYRQILL